MVSLAESTKRVRILFEELQRSSEAAPVDEDGDDDRRCSNNGVLCDIARGGWLMVVGQTERERESPSGGLRRRIASAGARFHKDYEKKY